MILTLRYFILESISLSCAENKIKVQKFRVKQYWQVCAFYWKKCTDRNIMSLNLYFLKSSISPFMQSQVRLLSIRYLCAAGQERFGALTSSYYRGAHGIILGKTSEIIALAFWISLWLFDMWLNLCHCCGTELLVAIFNVD